MVYIIKSSDFYFPFSHSYALNSFFLLLTGAKPNNETNTHLSQPLEENINRADIDTVEARTVDEALSVLRYIMT